jgi:hypothetical protein
MVVMVVMGKSRRAQPVIKQDAVAVEAVATVVMVEMEAKAKAQEAVAVEVATVVMVETAKHFLSPSLWAQAEVVEDMDFQAMVARIVLLMVDMPQVPLLMELVDKEFAF